MRSRCLMLFTVLVATFLAPGSTSTASPDVKPLGRVSLADESTNCIRKRSLREGSSASQRLGVSTIDNEERMGVAGAKEAIRWLWNAIKIRVRMMFWLFHGTTPEDVLEKLKVTSTTDKNYKYYSRYYFKYYVKYPDRQPPNSPTKTAEDIMKARLYDWLRNNLSPPEVFKELGFTGTFTSARGKPNYEYFELYSEMWNALQVRLSRANALYV